MTMLNEMGNQGEGGTKLNKDEIAANAQKGETAAPVVAADGETADKVQDLGAPVVKGDEDTGPFTADDSVPGKKKRRADNDNGESLKDVSKAKLVTKAYESLTELDKDTLSERYDAIVAAIAGDRLDEDSIDLSEEVNDLLGSEEDLTEEFRKKATSLFEARFAQSIREEKARLNDLYEEQLSEETQAIREDLTNKLDSYLDYAGSEWMKENQLAIDSGVKTEIAESFFAGLHDLMEQHNLDIPEKDSDILETTISENREIKEQLDSAIDTMISFKSQLQELYKEKAVNTICEDLTDNDKSKIVDLVEGTTFDSVKELNEKVQTFRDHYFSKEDKDESTTSGMVLSEEVLTSQESSDTDNNDKIMSDDPFVNELAEQVSRFGDIH